jgi:hypothetical protein
MSDDTSDIDELAPPQTGKQDSHLPIHVCKQEAIMYILVVLYMLGHPGALYKLFIIY